MRYVAVLSVLVLAACGGAAPSADGSAGTSRAEPPVEASTAASPAAPGSAAPETALEVVTLESLDGTSPMGFLEYLPPSYDRAGEPSPLLIFLHGAGEAGDGSAEALGLVDDLGIPQLIAAGDWPADRPFVVLAPQYAAEHAEGECGFGNDLHEFLRFATLTYNIDGSRLYVTGVSCGAIGLWDYLAAYGDERLAAAAPVSGHAEWAFEEAGCDLAGGPPLWAFHGADDEDVPVVHIEGPMDRLRECDGAEGAELELTILPDADHVSAIERTYDGSAGHDIYAWMLEHTRSPNP